MSAGYWRLPERGRSPFEWKDQLICNPDTMGKNMVAPVDAPRWQRNAMLSARSVRS